MEPRHLRIKRPFDSDDGIAFAYLAQKGQRQTDLACEAIRSYWLPLALKERGIKKKELKSIAWESISQLMKQVELIRLECGLSLDEVPFAHLYSVAPSNTPSNTAGVISNSAQPDSTHVENVGNTDAGNEDIEDDEDDDDKYDDEDLGLDAGFRS